jgi:hypothetical protein
MPLPKSIGWCLDTAWVWVSSIKSLHLCVSLCSPEPGWRCWLKAWSFACVPIISAGCWGVGKFSGSFWISNSIGGEQGKREETPQITMIMLSCCKLVLQNAVTRQAQGKGQGRNGSTVSSSWKWPLQQPQLCGSCVSWYHGSVPPSQLINSFTHQAGWEQIISLTQLSKESWFLHGLAFVLQPTCQIYLLATWVCGTWIHSAG